MSKRWKYQIKHGLFYAVIMAVIIGLFEMQNNTLAEIFFTQRFALKFVVLLLVGIFLIGYLNWRELQKKQ